MTPFLRLLGHMVAKWFSKELKLRIMYVDLLGQLSPWLLSS